MNKWLNTFLAKSPEQKPDKMDSGNFLSGLSSFQRSLFDQNLKNISRTKSDITDKTGSEELLSDLSGCQQGLFGKISSSICEPSDLLESYEERLAIAEYDGQQSPTQAERIAYLGAFVDVLVTLPYDEGEGDWFVHRIKAAKTWLLDQGIFLPK